MKKIEITGQKPDVETYKEKIDLNTLGKKQTEVDLELEKSEVQTAFVAVINQLEKCNRHDEAANLNRSFARLGEHQIQKRNDLLKPYSSLLED